MNKYILSLSHLIACTLIVSATASYASECTQLNHIVEKTYEHFTKRAVTWSTRFLKSTVTYDVLLVELKNHVSAFDHEVLPLLSTRTTHEETALTQQATLIVKEVRAMLHHLYGQLSKPDNYKNTIIFLNTMNRLQGTMATQLTGLENKLKAFKQTCSTHSSPEAQTLRTNILALEKVIAQFRKDNQNVGTTLLKRTSTLFKK